MTHTIWKSSVGATAVLLSLCGVARADESQCSNGTLKGTYSFGIHGALIGIVSNGMVNNFTAPELLDGVAVQTFSGTGSFTRTDFLMNTGLPRPGATNAAGFTEGETGSYTVNSDCTGSMEIKFPGAPNSGAVIDILFVVGDDGRIIKGVVNKEHVPSAGPTANGTSCSGADCFVAPQISVEGVKGDAGHDR
jgi:hypothetical protein